MGGIKMNTKRKTFAGVFDYINENPTRVTFWKLENINTKTIIKGEGIESLVDFFQYNANVVYFHNLKFYGAFILDYLEKQGIKYETLIGEKGEIYRIIINHTELRDSKKKIPIRYEDIGGAFGFNSSDNLENLAQALNFLYSHNMKGLTIGADCLKEFKAMNKHIWDRFFPDITLAEDLYFRRALFGGWVYSINGKYGEGRVLDFNSLYPYCSMSTHLLPFGKPVKFEGEPKPSKKHPLYIATVRAFITLKPGHLPFIREKNDVLWLNNGYITSTEEEPILLTLSNYDFQLLNEQYKVEIVEYLGGYYFQGMAGIFDEYMNKYGKIKEEATKEGNQALRTIAKLYMNNLIGKFMTKPIKKRKDVHLKNNAIKFKPSESVDSLRLSRVDIPVFILSIARGYTVRLAQLFYEVGAFIYSDTDSVHIIDTPESREIVERLYIDDSEIGALKIETVYDESIIVKPKTYAERVGDKWNVTASGLPFETREKLEACENLENLFKKGFTITKPMMRIVEGGAIYEETTYTIA